MKQARGVEFEVDSRRFEYNIIYYICLLTVIFNYKGDDQTINLSL